MQEEDIEPVALQQTQAGFDRLAQNAVDTVRRRIAEIARETGVATQIAVANQASESTRVLCEWIWDGAIGPVREAHVWVSRAWGLQTKEKSDQYKDIVFVDNRPAQARTGWRRSETDMRQPFPWRAKSGRQRTGRRTRPTIRCV